MRTAFDKDIRGKAMPRGKNRHSSGRSTPLPHGWGDDNSINIAVASKLDNCGSGYRLYEAIRLIPGVCATYVGGNSDKEIYKQAIEGADIIWSKGDYPNEIKNGCYYMYDVTGQRVHGPGSGHTVRTGVKTIISPSGSFFRRPIGGYARALSCAPLSMFTDSCDLLAPITPDLNYPEINGIYVPFAIDEASITNTWTPKNGIHISAYYGCHDSKHIEKHLMPAVTLAQKKHIPVHLTISRHRERNRQQFMQLMGNSTIYYEQITPIGIYGNSGTEAMAMGIPTIAGITDTAIKQALPVEGYGDACIKAYSSADVLKLLERISDNDIDLEEISHKSKEYVRRVHSYESIARYIEQNIIKKTITSSD